MNDRLAVFGESVSTSAICPLDAAGPRRSRVILLMMRRRIIATFATTALSTLIAHNGGAQSIVVHPPVRTSPRGVGPHFWWMIGTSPTDSKHLVVCALRNRPGTATIMQAVLYGSEDGGETWRTLFADSTGPAVSETACALSRGQTVYFNGSMGATVLDELVSWEERQGIDAMHLTRSTDFGKTWRDAPRDSYADNMALVVHPGTTSDNDRVIAFIDGVGATRTAPIKRGMLSSGDGARTFDGGRQELPDAPIDRDSTWIAWTGSATTFGDGTVGVMYWDHASSYKGKSYLTLTRTTPKGKPIGEPLLVATISGANLKAFEPDAPAARDDNFFYARFPSIASGAVPGTKMTRVYVAWHDLVKGRIHVLVSTSDDTGLTWSTPRVVDDIPTVRTAGRDTSASQPSIAVNAAGVVGIQWNEHHGRCWRFAASRDGGKTFEPSMPLNSCASEPLPFTSHLNDYLYSYEFGLAGPTVRLHVKDWRGNWTLFKGTGLAAAPDSTFRSAWVPFGLGDDGVYVSRIEVHGSPEQDRRRQLVASAVPDSSIAPAPQDARPYASKPAVRAWVDYTSFDYDERTSEFTVGVVLVREPGASPGQRWPSVLRVTTLSSPLGPLSVLDADNGIAKAGAAWVFDSLTDALPPGSNAALDRALPISKRVEYSTPRTLRFRLDGPPKQKRVAFGQDLLAVEFDVLIAKE